MLTLLAAGAMTKLLFATLFGVAVLGFGLAFAFMSGAHRGESIEQRLADLSRDTDEEEGDPVPHSDQVFAETKVMQRMVGITGRLADRAGLLTRIEAALEQADLPLRPPEALFFYGAAVFLLAVFSLLTLAPSKAVIVIFLALAAPAFVLQRRRTKRLRNFEEQLPDTLSLLSGSMRAGFSFAQGLESVANEASQPTRRELQRVFTESRLGRPIEDALEESANRMASIDLTWAVLAIRIQREVGGNLAELLDTVADTMKQRERMRGEIKALTAEGRFSGWILGIFPIAFAGVLYVSQPTYIGTLFSNSDGLMAIGASLVMTAIGFVWLRKILRIEV